MIWSTAMYLETVKAGCLVFPHLCQGSEYAFKQIIFLSGLEFPPLQVNVNLTEF